MPPRTQCSGAQNGVRVSFANIRGDALRLPARHQDLFKLPKVEPPRLKMESRGRIVIYFLDGDAYVEQTIEAIAEERARIFLESFYPSRGAPARYRLANVGRTVFKFQSQHTRGHTRGCCHLLYRLRYARLIYLCHMFRCEDVGGG